ncbi:MAG: hypothetical protein AAF735_03220 [Myxococcota bacterium]
MMRWLSVVAVLALSPIHAWAQAETEPSADRETKVRYKKVTKIDFSEGLIEGDLMRPEGSYVVSRKASRFSKLIRVRQNFVRELMFSYSEL